ncbi:MAG: 3-hydroxyacyl-CoA dehydrogenase NAD-binding domain-containing protein [Crocinitomicaceae bacterium]|jgi:3-hydroxybutyryl-CoA dehydrogenase
MKVVGVIGAGTMGIGIAQVAVQNNKQVVVIDSNDEVLNKSQVNLFKTFEKLVEKGKLGSEEVNSYKNALTFTTDYNAFKDADLVIEAIIENLEVKHTVFKKIEELVKDSCILASNTSSLSIASISSVLKNPSRFLGIHFFNPAPLMALVEIIPGVQTSSEVTQTAKEEILSWNKKPVTVKDTPGFIVNRVARPFYGEALRIYEEGIADFATIDWAMTHFGGFRMGPFTLMDYIGNDINYTVTESVFEAFYFDPRFKPSFTQKRHKEAGLLGRKTGKGYYDYSEGAIQPKPIKDEKIGSYIFNRILCMLINEAFDALFMKVASREDIDIAMRFGVNYPKGLLDWADEIGLEKVLLQLTDLFEEYGEDRYRPNPLLKRMVYKN